MTTPVFVKNVGQALKTHSPELLTGLGIAGVVTTAYLTAKSTVKAFRVIDKHEQSEGAPNDNKERIKERVQLTWRYYIPPAASGAATIGCIVGLQRVGSRRLAAVASAYAIAERGFSEYREKVVEQIGKGPEQKVRDSIAQDRVNARPPSGEVIYLGTGHVLCCELFTHRYFRSDMETLKKAQNDINNQINNQHYVALDEFYDIIGLPHTSNSCVVGWDSAKLMELKFSTVLAEDGQPCLAFDYNYTKPL